jgi:hypothetical protein
MQAYKIRMRTELSKIYSQDLLNNLFRHPYTKLDFVMTDLQVTRKTVARYLEELIEIGVLEKHRIKKDNFYLNRALFDLLHGAGERPEDDA